MKKILLATAAGASLLAATFVAIPAHADGMPTTSSTLENIAPAQKIPEFKVDFNWNIPTNVLGAPYDTCNVQLIRADGSVANEAPFPASLPKLTYKLDAAEAHDANFTPGLSTLSLNYTCFNNAGDTSEVQRIDSVVIPDVVPTAPAYVDVVDPDALYPTVSFGGSETLGVAKLEGYKVDVTSGNALVSSDYTSVPNSSVRGAARVQARTANIAASSLSTTLSNLPTGLYRVQVQGVNAVGLSETTSTDVMIYAKASATTTQIVKVPGHVRTIKAKVTKSSATVTWKAPTNHAATNYSVKISGKGKVKTYSVGTKTTVNFTGLKKNTNYNVWVTAIGAQSNLTSLTASHFKTKKS